MLKQRIITALILLPLVLGLILNTQLDFFAGVIAVVVYLLALEWGKLVGFKHHYQNTIYALMIASINLLVWFFADQLVMWPSPSWPFALVWDYPMIILSLGVLVVIGATVIVFGYSLFPRWWSNQVVLILFGMALLPTFFISFISIRSVGYLADFYRGGQFLLLMFAIVWAADTGAFIAGKLFGKHKLAPAVSPNKTWEGAVGGFLLSFVIAWLGVYFINFDINNKVIYSTVVVLLAVFSVLGDLFESALKRAVNIKDSGSLLPGHGGLLDRLDSTLIVAPLFYLTFSYFGWFR